MAGGYEFRDLTSLTRWTKRSIVAHLAISCIAVVSGYLEHDLLVGFREGLFESEERATASAETSDTRQAIVGAAQLIILMTSGYLSLRWIHRAAGNARALGATGLEFTPGWAVGWYFIPILNLWKPYRAMKEIWQASANPADWRLERPPALLRWWWALWLIDSVLANLSFRLAWRAEEIDELLRASRVTLASDIAAIPLSVAFLLVIHRVHALQSRCASVPQPPSAPSPHGVLGV